MHDPRLRILLFLAALAAASPASAQLGVEARIGGTLDSLGDAGGSAEDRAAAAGSLDLEYRFAEQRARLFYALDAARYSTGADWTTLSHELGAVHRFDLTSSGRARLFVAATVARRDNGDAWAAVGYRGLGGRANLEWKPRDGAALRVGYRIDGRDFPDLPELDQVEQDAFASALLNFQTRTTLIAEIHTGLKSYAGGLAESAVATDATSGRGRGRLGLTPRGALPSRDAGERAGRIAWLVRVAQSLADRVGLSVQYDARDTFGEVAPAVVEIPAHFEDDGVYDDPYASDARAARATLKGELGALGTARAWGAWQRKDYTRTPALALDGTLSGETRADRIWRAGAGWTLPLFPERSGPVTLDLELVYAFARHRSNDAVYDYTSHAVGLSLSVAY